MRISTFLFLLFFLGERERVLKTNQYICICICMGVESRKLKDVTEKIKKKNPFFCSGDDMTNFYNDQQRALKYLADVLKKLPKEGIQRKPLVMEMLTVFPVSERALNRYIDSCIESGDLTERSGILLRTKAAKQ